MPFLFIALFYRNVFEIAVRHLSPLGRSTFCILIPSPLGPNSGNVPSPCRVFFSMWVIDDEEGNFSYSADKAFIGTLLVKGGTGRRWKHCGTASTVVARKNRDENFKVSKWYAICVNYFVQLNVLTVEPFCRDSHCQYSSNFNIIYSLRVLKHMLNYA